MSRHATWTDTIRGLYRNQPPQSIPAHEANPQDID
jgi:hypothetical protein